VVKARVSASGENGPKVSGEFFVMRDNESIKALDEIDRTRCIDEISGPRLWMPGKGVQVTPALLSLDYLQPVKILQFREKERFEASPVGSV
jgi:hypothetical protein